MPYTERCERSGALLFHLTDEEKAVKQTLEEVNALKDELAEKLELVNKVLEASEAKATATSTTGSTK